MLKTAGNHKENTEFYLDWSLATLCMVWITVINQQNALPFRNALISLCNTCWQTLFPLTTCFSNSISAKTWK